MVVTFARSGPFGGRQQIGDPFSPLLHFLRREIRLRPIGQYLNHARQRIAAADDQLAIDVDFKG